MTIVQLLHILGGNPPWARWGFSVDFYQLLFAAEGPREILPVALEPLDRLRHIPRGKAQTKAQPQRNGKVEVTMKPAPRIRYQLYLGGVPARVSDDNIALLNDIGDIARKQVIQGALERIEAKLLATPCPSGEAEDCNCFRCRRKRNSKAEPI